MKRTLLICLFLLLIPLTAQAQKTLQDAAAATGAGSDLVINVGAQQTNGVTAQVSGTFSGTITWRATVDGTNFVDVQGSNLTTGVTATTATAAGLYSFLLPRVSTFRAPITTYSSGSITVVAAAAVGVARVYSEGGDAPTDATYVTQTPNSTLSAEQALSALATGLLKNTTTTGVLSIAGASDLPSGIDAAKIADGSVSNAEFQRLDGVTSGIQSQIDGKQAALGFTAENVANKDTDGTLAANSDTKYASQKATKTYADTKEVPLMFSSPLVRTTNTVACATCGVTGSGLNQFASTNSAQFLGVISNETGSGLVVGNDSPVIITPTIASFANANHTHQNSAGGGTLAEAALALTDITTNNVSTSAHGFTPKLPNDATKYLDGTGAYSVPAGSGGGIIVGTTTVSGASDTQSFYNNNGVVGVRTVTGTGNDVLATSPTFTTSLLTGSTTFAVFNVTPTTINAFGAATTINIGAASATWNIGSNSTINGGTAANDDISIQGTSSATRTTSYVAIQPNGGGVLLGAGSSGGSAFVEIKSQGNSQYPLRVLRSGGAAQTLYGVWEEFDGSAQLFMNDGSNVNTIALLTAGDSYIKGGKLGIGTSTVSARLHSLATTEQLRLGYDASNYFSTTVGSTGGVTLNAVGSGSLFTFSDNINIPHVIGGTSAPSIAPGAGAGTSPTVSLTGTDLAGQLNITSGTLPSVSAVISTITFNVAYGVAPYCLMWPANSAAAVLGFLPYISSTTTTFTVNAATVGLAGATQYLYNYVCTQ